MLLRTDAVLNLQAQMRMAEPAARSRPDLVRDKSYSNKVVTPESALTVSAVISIIRLKAQDLASIPLLLYARRGRNKFRAFESTYYRLMHDQPNPEMSSVVFRELILSHIDAWGNFFGQIIADERGTAVEVWPLRPDRMRVERVDGQKVYIYSPLSGGKPIVFAQEEILHIPGYGFDGLVGYSRITLARNAIGLMMSMEEYGSKFFGNNTHLGVTFKHPGTLSDVAYTRLKEELDVKAGVEKSHKPFVLEEGMSVERMGIPPEDAQFLESRRFQISEINRMIGPVPPHMIGDIEKSTSWGSGIDSQEQGYINHSLFPYARRIEQALDNQLLLSTDRAQGFFYEHLFDGFLRGDIQTRYEAYVKAIANGFMSRNEARERENMNPRTGLDEMLVPLNMTGSSTTSSEPPESNALASLWRDAVGRVVKREMQDLQGAARRFLAKDQADAWQAWVDQFYEVDHPMFVQKQFEALCEAQSRLYGSDLEPVNAYVHDVFTEHAWYVKELSFEGVEETIVSWSAGLSDEMSMEILKILEVPHE